MKPVTVGLLALVCLVGVALAQYGGGGYGGGYGGNSGSNYSFLWLIGALVLIMFLFGSNRGSTFSGTTRLIYGNYSSFG